MIPISDIAHRLEGVKKSLLPGVNLVAVSKYHPVEALRQAYDAGQRIFGESRAAELVQKNALMPSDVEWHFIGHLQTNKLKAVIPLVSVVQSVDTEHLLQAIDAESVRIGKTTGVLLQVHVAAEESKYGFNPDELLHNIEVLCSHLKGVSVRGIMGMATNTDDIERVKADFKMLKYVFDTLKAGYFRNNPAFDTLSMGMSHDRDIAMACGSTMVRVGTDIFGDREY